MTTVRNTDPTSVGEHNSVQLARVQGRIVIGSFSERRISNRISYVAFNVVPSARSGEQISIGFRTCNSNLMRLLVESSTTARAFGVWMESGVNSERIELRKVERHGEFTSAPMIVEHETVVFATEGALNA